MRRRARALAFLTAAVICAILAAAVAGRYRSRVEGRYGPLRPVVVATIELPAGHPIDPGRVQSSLTVRRIPASFVPPGALTRPVEAVGEVPSAAIPSGSYVLAAQLAPPAPPRSGSPRAMAGRRPLQVNIAGAQALTLGGEPPEGRRVDVVVARQAGLGNSARAYIAATGIRLLALQGPVEPGDPWSATLAVTEQQALSLIGAQSAGREIRLLPRP